MGRVQCRICLFVGGLIDLSRDTNNWKVLPTQPPCSNNNNNYNKTLRWTNPTNPGKNARYTVRQLARMTNLPLSCVHCILKKHLELKKNNASWIPHLQTDDQKRSRVEKAKSLLKNKRNAIFPSLQRKCSNRLLATKDTRRPSIAKNTYRDEGFVCDIL